MSLALNTVVSNEEHRILGLLEHASGFCDELVVVVDEHSADGTLDLAREFGAKTIIGPHSWYCEPLRPLAAAHTNADWILVLDGDEVINPERLPQLLALDRTLYKAAWLPRLNLVDGVNPYKSLDGHVRYFEKGSVVYGSQPHTKIFAKDDNFLFTPNTRDWIIHSKTSAEQQRDEVRTEANL